MNNRFILFVIAFEMFSAHFAVDAYKLSTHARMAYKAHEQTVLRNDDKLIKDLGIDLSNPNDPFGSVYHDVIGTKISECDISIFLIQVSLRGPIREAKGGIA